MRVFYSDFETSSTLLDMRVNVEIGEVQCLPYETKDIEWRIPDFFALLENKNDCFYMSPPFTTKDALWYLRLWSRSSDDDCMLIDMWNNVIQDREYKLAYSFGLKKEDGTVEDIILGNVEGNIICSGWKSFIKRTELLRRKTELVPSNILTVTCTITYEAEVPHSAETTELDKTKSMMLTGLDKLSEVFKGLFENKERCDVTLKVQNRDYKAHRCVLIARSSVFAATFKHDTLEHQTEIITITDCDPNSFQIFLKYLYCGKLEKFSFSSALDLYYTSLKYDVEELKAFCVEYLMKSLIIDNVCELAIFADKYDEMQLSSAVKDFFNKNFYSIIETSAWKDLVEKDFHLGNKLLKGMLPKVKFVDSEIEQSQKIKKIKLN